MTHLVPLLLLFVWIYVASCFVEDGFYNLYVNRVRQALFRPVTWLQGLSPRLPEWGAAALLLALVALALSALPKALAANAAASFGGVPLFAPRASPPRTLALRAGSFATLLGQVALLRLAFVWRFGRFGGGPVRECLDVAAWPLSLPRDLRAAAGAAAGALLAGGWLCAWSASSFGNVPVVHRAWPALAGGAETGALPLRLAALGAVDLLELVRWLLLVGCVLSWGTLLSPRLAEASGMAHEWIDAFTALVLGPDRPLAVGFVSFAPLVLFFLLGYLHPLLARLLL